MGEKHRIIPVWFFVGVLLFIYGMLILVTGILEWSDPPDTVLSSLRAPVWWGALLVVVGGFYTLAFRPGRAAGGPPGPGSSSAQKSDGGPASKQGEQEVR